MRRVVSDPRFIVSGLFLLLLFFLAVFGPMVAPYPEDRVNAEQQLKPPGGGYLLGTDEFGRDILTRIILGARLTMLVSFGSVAIAAVSGTAIGLVAGYFGGKIEMALMRAVDAMLSFPPFVLAIFVLTFMGPKLENLILTIGILFIPRYARVAHVVTLAAKERDYVEAARSIGARAWRIIASGHPAERLRPADRPDLARRRQRHPHRIRAQLPGPRSTAARGLVGAVDPAVRALHAAESARGHLAVARDLRRRPRVQHHR